MNDYDLLIVGGGAAGLAAGIFAAQAAAPSTRIAILDSARALGAKILVSGGGRCNVTHQQIGPDDYNANRPIVRNILAAFDHLGGFALYVQDGKLKHRYSMLGVMEYTQESEAPLPTGDVGIELVFAADAPKPATGGEVTLLVNGEQVASGRMEHTVPSRFSFYAGMDIGCDNGHVVDPSYADKAPFRFTGEIKQVTFDIAPHLDEEGAQALHAHAAQALAAHAASA